MTELLEEGEPLFQFGGVLTAASGDIGRGDLPPHVPLTASASVITAVLPNSVAVIAAAEGVEPLPRITRS